MGKARFRRDDLVEGKGSVTSREESLEERERVLVQSYDETSVFDDVDLDFDVDEYEEDNTEKENMVINDERNDTKAPLLVCFTSDGASVLTGKKSGVNVRLREKCNHMMLNAHCVSHRCQLGLKKTASDKCKPFKELFTFLEQLFVFHKTSNVISNVYRETVKQLNVTASSSVIRVNGTRWINHVKSALTNLLNSRSAHIQAYETIIAEKDYSQPQKAKAKFFLSHLYSCNFMSFTVFTLDVLESISCFSLVRILTPKTFILIRKISGSSSYRTSN